MDDGDSIAGVYLTNAAYTMNSIINGDDFMGEPFKQGDFYKVVFTGKDVNGVTVSSVEHYLIDYRSSNSSEHFALTEWKWFDLSALGKVAKVVISIDASRANGFGLTVPEYFCMDNFGSSKPDISIVNADSVSLSEHSITIMETETHQLTATVFPENTTNKNVVWESSDPTVATVDADGLVTAVSRGTAKIIVITEDGQFSDTCAATVTFTTDIEQSKINKIEVYPTVTAGPVHILLSGKTTKTAHITDVHGKVLQTVRLQPTENTIDLTSFKAGLYLIRTEDQVVKVIKL
jgi:uncharacterized protein YjdB